MSGMVSLVEEIFDDLSERAAENFCEHCSMERSWPCPCEGYIGESERCLYGEKWETFCEVAETAKNMLINI